MKPDRKTLLIIGTVFISIILFLSVLIIRSKKNFLLKIQPKEVTIILTGDMMIGRSVMIKSFDLKNYAYPFRKVGETLNAADIVFGNLENPVVTGCPIANEGFKLCADPKMIEGLVNAGFDVVTLANNHITNYGQKGFEETINLLNQNGIKTVGMNNLVIEEKGDKKFGFLGFDFTLHELTDSDLQLITDSDKLVDVLIVGVHWGEEYKSKANSLQQSIANRLVESGTDVVVGHHPHWVQNSEKISGKPVYYSLGNFIFDQMWSEETKKGMVIKLTFKDGELINEEQLPVYISSLGQPEFIK